MEVQKNKCSLKKHIDIKANIYSKKCEIYIALNVKFIILNYLKFI